MPGGSADRIVDPDVVKSIIGTADLREGMCAHRDPMIWSGEWCDMSGGSKAARALRWGKMRKAVGLCRACPVLDACEKQLQAFEDAGCRVTGVMAARQWGQPREEDQVVECRSCYRPMHIRPRGIPAPPVPEGHALSQCRGLCSTCYSRAKKDGTLDQIAEPPRPGNHRATTQRKEVAA